MARVLNEILTEVLSEQRGSSLPDDVADDIEKIVFQQTVQMNRYAVSAFDASCLLRNATGVARLCQVALSPDTPRGYLHYVAQQKHRIAYFVPPSTCAYNEMPGYGGIS